MDYAIEEVHNWLNDDNFSDSEKVEGIASVCFLELSDEKKIDMIIDLCGDDFGFFIELFNNIDLIAYDFSCSVELLELMHKKIQKEFKGI